MHEAQHDAQSEFRALPTFPEEVLLAEELELDEVDVEERDRFFRSFLPLLCFFSLRSLCLDLPRDLLRAWR